MCALHQYVVVAYDGLTTGMRSTVDDHVLADDIVVANDALRPFATEVEVLGQSADDAALMHLVVTAHACTAEDADEGEDDAVVANLYVILDVDEREYLAVVADACLGAYLGFWTYFAVRHNN